MVPIKTQLANRSNYGGIRDIKNIIWLVLHYTSVDGDTDENNGKYFQNNVVKASAHYFVDDDSITQSVPDNYVAYSVGGAKLNSFGKYHGQCTNSNSISIELCDTVRNGVVYPTQKAINNAVELTRMLMDKYNIDINHVIRHRDVTGKECPKYWIDDTKWENEFKRFLKNNFMYNEIDYSAVFDPKFYAEKYPDVGTHPYYGQNEATLFEHFTKYGIKEKRQGNKNFNVKVYMENNPDLNVLFFNHFLQFGIKEDRKVV